MDARGVTKLQTIEGSTGPCCHKRVGQRHWPRACRQCHSESIKVAGHDKEIRTGRPSSLMCHAVMKIQEKRQPIINPCLAESSAHHLQQEGKFQRQIGDFYKGQSVLVPLSVPAERAYLRSIVSLLLKVEATAARGRGQRQRPPPVPRRGLPGLEGDRKHKCLFALHRTPVQASDESQRRLTEYGTDSHSRSRRCPFCRSLWGRWPGGTCARAPACNHGTIDDGVVPLLHRLQRFSTKNKL